MLSSTRTLLCFALIRQACAACMQAEPRKSISDAEHHHAQKLGYEGEGDQQHSRTMMQVQQLSVRRPVKVSTPARAIARLLLAPYSAAGWQVFAQAVRCRSQTVEGLGAYRGHRLDLHDPTSVQVRSCVVASLTETEEPATDVNSRVSESSGYAPYTLVSSGLPEVASVLERALLAQWRHVPSDDPIGMNSFYKYPAPLRHSASCELLRLLPEGTLLDPFCGSGGSLIEALASGRHAIGNDASPLALFASLHHTLRPGEECLSQIKAAALDAAKQALDRVSSDNRSNDKAGSWKALAESVRDAEAAHPTVSELRGDNAAGQSPTPLWFCFASAMRRAENDLSAAPGHLFCETVDNYCEAVMRLERAAPLADIPPPTLLHGDARLLNCTLLPGERPVDAILTSPPYPGVYDYLSLAREERTRLSFQKKRTRRKRKTRGPVPGNAGKEHIDENSSVAQGPPLMGLENIPAGRDWPAGWTSNAEIGAHKALRRRPAEFAKEWQADQEAWLRAAKGCLRSGGLAAVVIGDGDALDTLASTVDAAHAVGLVVEGTASICSTRKRALRVPGNRRTEHALLLRAP